MGKRGKAGNIAQLSRLQCEILLWLEHHSHGTCLDNRGYCEPKPSKVKVSSKGVSWSAKRFYDDPEPTSSQQAALSRALRRLEKRGLVVCLRVGTRAAHVLLTEPGWSIASHWRVWGASLRGMSTALTSTPEGRQKAELQARLAKLRGALVYALDEGDEQLEAKLVMEVRGIEDRLAAGFPLLKRASIEVLMKDFPDSVLMQGLRAVQFDHPEFFERAVFGSNSQKAAEGPTSES